MEKDFVKMLEERNEKNNFGNLLGIKVVSIREGEAVAEMEIKEFMQNPIGSIHGGCIFTLADIATGSASVSYGQPATTQSYNIHYLRPVFENTQKLTASAKVLKRGKRGIVIEVMIEDDEKRLIAAGMATHMPLDIDLKATKK